MYNSRFQVVLSPPGLDESATCPQGFEPVRNRTLCHNLLCGSEHKTQYGSYGDIESDRTSVDDDNIWCNKYGVATWYTHKT